MSPVRYKSTSVPTVVVSVNARVSLACGCELSASPILSGSKPAHWPRFLDDKPPNNSNYNNEYLDCYNSNNNYHNDRGEDNDYNGKNVIHYNDKLYNDKHHNHHNNI
ncbi:hypothetical protein MRX96_057422 [Rhipicephalus microplus]